MSPITTSSDDGYILKDDHRLTWTPQPPDPKATRRSKRARAQQVIDYNRSHHPQVSGYQVTRAMLGEQETLKTLPYSTSTPAKNRKVLDEEPSADEDMSPWRPKKDRCKHLNVSYCYDIATPLLKLERLRRKHMVAIGTKLTRLSRLVDAIPAPSSHLLADGEPIVPAIRAYLVVVNPCDSGNNELQLDRGNMASSIEERNRLSASAAGIPLVRHSSSSD